MGVGLFLTMLWKASPLTIPRSAAIWRTNSVTFFLHSSVFVCPRIFFLKNICRSLAFWLVPVDSGLFWSSRKDPTPKQVICMCSMSCSLWEAELVSCRGLGFFLESGCHRAGVGSLPSRFSMQACWFLRTLLLSGAVPLSQVLGRTVLLSKMSQRCSRAGTLALALALEFFRSAGCHLMPSSPFSWGRTGPAGRGGSSRPGQRKVAVGGPCTWQHSATNHSKESEGLRLLHLFPNYGLLWDSE